MMIKHHQFLKSPPTGNMASSSHLVKALPSLLNLPNKLQLDIVSCLSISDVRQLSRVSRRLHLFTREYLARYRYTSDLINLPKRHNF
jgi:hypothetical protein